MTLLFVRRSTRLSTSTMSMSRTTRAMVRAKVESLRRARSLKRRLNCPLFSEPTIPSTSSLRLISLFHISQIVTPATVAMGPEKFCTLCLAVDITSSFELVSCLACNSLAPLFSYSPATFRSRIVHMCTYRFYLLCRICRIAPPALRKCLFRFIFHILMRR